MAVHNVKLLHREEVAENTLAFHLERPDGFSYKGGQAIDVTLLGPTSELKGQHRIFSLVSAPYESDLVVATRLRNSAFKNGLKATKVGDLVQLEGPFGSLALHANRARAAVFIAGGIGITPFVSILRQAENDHLNQHFLLVYANRRPEDAPYLSELADRAQRHRYLRLVATMTGMSKSGRRWEGERSRIDEALLARFSGDLPEPVYYIAGPPAMVNAIRQIVQRMGVSDDDIRSEDFFGY